MERMGRKVATVCSAVLLFLSMGCARAQSVTTTTPQDFPLGLVLKYDSTTDTWGTTNPDTHSSSPLEYRVVSWVANKGIAQIVYSGEPSGNGLRYVKIPDWSSTDIYGTPTGEFVDPLWMSTDSLRAGSVSIPPGDSQSRVYTIDAAQVNVPVGQLGCWHCRANWTEGNFDVQRDYYYEYTLGVLVTMVEVRSPTHVDWMNGYYYPYSRSAYLLINSSILATILPKTEISLPGLHLSEMVVWFALSVTVLVIPVIITLVPRRTRLETNTRRNQSFLNGLRMASRST